MLKNMHHRPVRRVMEAISKAYMRATIDDPALREKLTPDFEIGCKRILITSVWYPALNQPNVDLETSRITEIRDHAVVTEDGTEHEVDAIVCATGFHVTDPPIAGRVHGRNGQSLAEWWGDAPKAYRGVTTTNFPNLFRIGSIGTGTGHMSQIMQIESAITYVMDAMRLMEERGIASVEVTQDAQDQYARRVHEMASQTVWATGGCNSWYLDPSGEPSAVWPSSAWHYRKWTEHFDVEAYRVTTRAAVGAPAGEAGRAATRPFALGSRHARNHVGRTAVAHARLPPGRAALLGPSRSSPPRPRAVSARHTPTGPPGRACFSRARSRRSAWRRTRASARSRGTPPATSSSTTRRRAVAGSATR